MKFRSFAAAALATATISAGIAAPASAQTLTETAQVLALFGQGKEALAKMDCNTAGVIQKVAGGTKEQTRTQYQETLKKLPAKLGVESTLSKLATASYAKTIADKALECKLVKADPAPSNPIEALLQSSSNNDALAMITALSSKK